MTKSNNLPCPLATTEQRLSDCISLWLETKNSYFSPDSFRLNLNNCIQTMRNVTFVLQKTKSQFNNFDDWYNTWQNRMRKDNIMTWLIQARNVIVKEGDLSTSSKLRVAVVENWFTPPYIEIDMHPFVDTEDFIRLLAKHKPNNIDLKVGLLRAERRWVDKQLKEYELLEALSHVFIVLSDLLLDAHENLCYPKDLLKCPWHTQCRLGENRYPDAMKTQEWDRTIWLDLNTGEVLQPASFPVRKIDDEELKKHYPDLQHVTKKFKKLSSLEEEAYANFEIAKTMFNTDGYLVPVVILGYPDGHRDIIALQMRDRAEKHLAIRRLAAEIEKGGATSL